MDGEKGTHAELKALREGCGLSQVEVAKAADTGQRSIARWESTDERYDAPKRVWRYLREVERTQDEQVKYCVDAAKEQAKALGDPTVVALTYYQSQEQYDKFGRDEGPVGWANAVARKTAAELRRLGFEVEFRYPNEGAIPTPGSRY